MSANRKTLQVICCVGVLLVASRIAVADPAGAHVWVELEQVSRTNVTDLEVISSVSEAWAGGSDGINVSDSDRKNGQAVTRTKASAIAAGASAQAATKPLYVYADARTSCGVAYAGAPGGSPGFIGTSQRWAFTSVENEPVTFTFDVSYAIDLATTLAGEWAGGQLWVGIGIRGTANNNADWHVILDPVVEDGDDFSESVLHQIVSVTTPLPVSPGAIGDLTIEVYVNAGDLAIPVAVSDLVSVSEGRTRYNRRTQENSVRMTITNTSDTAIGAPVWVVIESIDGAGVSLLGSSGRTVENYDYIDVTNLLSDDRLDPGEKISPTLSFSNPWQVEFTFTYSIRGAVPPG